MLLGEGCSVGGPGEVLFDVHPQEFSAADSPQSGCRWSGGVVTRVSPEVHHNLLCLTHIEGQVVCTTPFSQLCHFLSVVRFIVVGSVESGVSHLDSLGFRSSALLSLVSLI